MYTTYFDDRTLTDEKIAKRAKALTAYSTRITESLEARRLDVPEISLGYCGDAALHSELAKINVRSRKVKRVIVVGIGGSSLGLEAVWAVLGGDVALTVLDTVSAQKIAELEKTLTSIKKVEQLAVCVISKSGGTTETLANASVLLRLLETKYGSAVYAQTYFIGDAGTSPLRYGKKHGAHTLAMPTCIGGRYSVATEVGLVPMALLGYDTEAFCAGFLEASLPEYEDVARSGAARLVLYIEARYRHYNFFAFDSRLATLGAWYRQLFAESIGKAQTVAGKPFAGGMLPTISTPTELHSIGQLYLSGFAGVYTDFVTFDDDAVDYKVAPTKLAPTLKRFTLQDINAGLYTGVIGAYRQKHLPYRATIFADPTLEAIGRFMGMRLRETMYVASLLNLNAFDQPNVELYKQKTREALKL